MGSTMAKPKDPPKPGAKQGAAHPPGMQPIPSNQSGSVMPPHGPSPHSSLPPNNFYRSSYESDVLLSDLTGWSLNDISRLRHEFNNYAYPYSEIDRESFLKIYIASLLNMPWEAIVDESEHVFRNFDINRTGSLDFSEYITACTHMSRELNHPSMN